MIEIRTFDPRAAQPAEWAAVHAFRRLRAEEDTPGEPVLDNAEFERDARELSPLWDDCRWYAWREGEIVGSGRLTFRREGTADYAAHAPYVFPWGAVSFRERRRGIAVRLLAPMLEIMRDRGKTLAVFNSQSVEGDAFLSAIGAELQYRQVATRAAFGDLDWDTLARWEAGMPQDLPLRWEIYAGRVPHERWETLDPQLATCWPELFGELDAPRPVPGAWRAWYAELDRHGGDHNLILLMDGDRIAALFETYWDARFPERVHQTLLAVTRPWRKLGVAKCVAARMFKLIRESRPNIRYISNEHSSLNAPILAMAKEMGFVTFRQSAKYQIGVSALENYLTRRRAGLPA